MRLTTVPMAGTISSCGFASGDRFVVGSWRESPIGRTVDVMWARPDGTRVLLAPDDATADFVTSVYEFDEVRVLDLTASATPRHLVLRSDVLQLSLKAGGPSFVLPPRPLWFTRFVERPVAFALLGVRTWGTSPTGVQEWYQARRCSLVSSASATLNGVDLGGRRSLRPTCGFGFSESPPWPTIVDVRPTLGVPEGWLAARTGRQVVPSW
ncbi:MAG: hypothetical protein ACOYOQ_04900 [Microthrixaceae bacterium]